MSAERVVITGIGVATPLGSSLESFRAGLLEGRSGAAEISLFDAGGFRTHIAAQAVGVDAPPLGDRQSAFALHAAHQALAHAQATGRPLHSAPGRTTVSAGIGLELFSMPDMVRWLQAERAPGDEARPQVASSPAGGASGPSSHQALGDLPADFLQAPADRSLHTLARELGFTRMPLLHVSACAASTDAIGHAMRLLRGGRLDWALAGGADSMINPMGLAGFCKLQALTTRNEEPQAASRPFDARRDGFLLGEGAAMFVLETLSHAQRRGATVLAELLGHGNSFDAYGISEPHPEGAGALSAMRRALADAGLSPEAVVHVNAHGTSTPKNDPAEAAALRSLFGVRLEQVSVNATKSMIGHLIAASGAVELAAQVLCARSGWLHATINLDEVDPACALDHVRGSPRRLQGPELVLLKNSFAFGGQNACLALRVPVAP